MKHFLSRLLYFLIPLLLFSFAADLTLSHSLRRSNKYPGETEVWNDIYKGTAGCDIAIYGSSRAWVQIDPEILKDSLNQKCYNFGMDGHNFQLQYLRHLELIKHNRKPTHIVLSVDMFSLEKRKDLYESDQFLPFMLWNNNIRNFTDSYIGYRDVDYYLPLIRFSGKYKAVKTGISLLRRKAASKPYRKNGFRAMDRTWNSDFEKAQETNNKYVVKIDRRTVALFEQFIRECNKENIELTLLYAPEYKEGQDFVSNRKEVMDIFRAYSKKYDLEFIDYSDDSICLDKNLFYNASHLNRSGASLFSKKLASSMKRRSAVKDLHPDKKNDFPERN
jgi:hypothetical protein